MSERACIRGCTVRDVHFATCENNSDYEIRRRNQAAESGEVYVGPCKGCAPRECRDGSLICDQCFGRARALLSDAPDLLGRLRSLGDPSKSGWNWDRGEVIRTSSPHPPAPIGDDLIDAIHAVETAVRYFGADITAVSNDAEAMGWLGPLVLDRHAPDADGVREGWSLRDAVDRWGVERQDTFRFPRRLPNAPIGSYSTHDEAEEPVSVTGWYDPPLTVAQAAKARGVSQEAVRKWVRQGLVPEGMLMRSRGARGSTLTATFASLWFAIHPCPMVHPGAWCTRVDGHPGECDTRSGGRPEPTNHMNGSNV